MMPTADWSDLEAKAEARRSNGNGCGPADGQEARRSVQGTRASSIKVRPVHWLWDGRLPLGSLALIAGREGIGKSTIAYTLAADVTRGRLPGVFHEVAKSVIVAATEDSWAHTIVPRLMAAGADLERVYRVDVTSGEGIETELSLPVDIPGLTDLVREADAALILLDPLMSRLHATLDSHKDGEVRQALEPVVRMADACGAVVLGLIHVNKGGGADALNAVMGSRAFVAVARSVLFVMADPDEEGLRLFGQPKNNLGRSDLPTLTFRIEGAVVAETDEGPVWTGRVVWAGESDRSVADALEAAMAGGLRSATQEAADWLKDYLDSQGGGADSAAVKTAGRAAGHNAEALKRAVRRLKVDVEAFGFPRRTHWSLPGRPGGEPVKATGSDDEPF